MFRCALPFFTIRKKIDKWKKWKSCIKFCVKNVIEYARTFEILIVAFGKSTMSRTQVQLWYNRFKKGREDHASPGPLSKSTTDENIEAVKKMILNSRQITSREIADYVGISFGPHVAIFTALLGIKRAAAKTVSKLLNFEQKNVAWPWLRKCLCRSTANSDLLKKVITDDEA